MSKRAYFARLAFEKEIARLKAEIERLSVDAVTGIAGRGVLDRELDNSFARSKRSYRPMAVLMVDADNFKSVNDDFGHDVGDRVLRYVAETLKSGTRRVDSIGRYGGEEFVVVIENTTPAGVAAMAENMRLLVESSNLPGYPLVTVSIGWSIQEHFDTCATDILKRADAAMYAAKAGGRNRVERGEK